VRFGSPLGIHDFLTRSSTIRYAPEALAKQAAAITTLARLEGLDAHARAVEIRVAKR
jgi:histidinol dehydrogenase